MILVAPGKIHRVTIEISRKRQVKQSDFVTCISSQVAARG